MIIKTLEDFRDVVDNWLIGEGSSIAQAVKDDAINDSIQSLWQSLMQASLSNFVGGPVTITTAANDERIAVDSIADPTTGPTISETTSGALASHTIYGAYTLVTESGSETLPSETTTQLIAINKIATMVTPSFVAGAYGWNCYMGMATNRKGKQNTDPVAFGTNYSEPTTGAVLVPDAPGVPAVNNTNDDLYYIRRIESNGPVSGTYLRWEGGDIDSNLMTLAAMQIGVNSPYQTYAWDFLDGRKIEIRPRAAGTTTGRYFYVKKPRRLAFAGSPVPFRNMPADKFLRVEALANLSVGLASRKQFDLYNAQAAQERALLVGSMRQQAIPQNQTVAPFMR